VTTSVSLIDLAKDRRSSSVDKCGSGRTVYTQRASASGQSISVVLLTRSVMIGRVVLLGGKRWISAEHGII